MATLLSDGKELAKAISEIYGFAPGTLKSFSLNVNKLVTLSVELLVTQEQSEKIVELIRSNADSGREPIE